MNSNLYSCLIFLTKFLFPSSQVKTHPLDQVYTEESLGMMPACRYHKHVITLHYTVSQCWPVIICITISVVGGLETASYGRRHEQQSLT